MKIIEIKGLTKKYKDVVAVDNLNLDINKGELFALLGVNGAGKTTTIKMLSCLLKPTSGDAFINGKSINEDDSYIKSIIAISPQESAVSSTLTVKENLELMCELHGFKKDKTKGKVEDLSKLLSIDSVLNKRVSKLSGGYERRLSIAMALISEPEILFLDEPTLGLDVISRSDLWDIIKSLKAKVTIILTTHYMEEAEKLSDKIAIMKDGKLLICDTVNHIKESVNASSIEDAFIQIVKGV